MHQPRLYVFGTGFITMVSYRYDQLQFSTAIPNFINIGTVTATLNVSGTIANGSGKNFIVQPTLTTFTTFADIKITNAGTGDATYLTNDVAIDPIWQYTSTELVQNSVSFLGSLVTIEISVSNNTGSSITLVNQTYDIEIIEYQLPF